MNWLTKSLEAHALHDLPESVLESAAAQSEFFTGLPARELAQLNRLGTIIDVPEGQTIVQQDTLGLQCVVVLSGQLQVERDGQPVGGVSPGFFAGEMSMLHHERCNATVSSSEDSVVYAMGRGDFQTLIATCPQIRARVKDVAGTRALETEPGS